jgi:hypothetical protein
MKKKYFITSQPGFINCIPMPNNPIIRLKEGVKTAAPEIFSGKPWFSTLKCCYRT